MTPEVPVEPTPAGMGAFARIAGVFFEPGKTFEDIARRPTWLLPLLIIVIGVVGFTSIYGQHVGWERVVRQQLENSSRTAQMTPEVRDRAIAAGAKFAPIIGYASAIMVPIGYLITAAVLLAMAAMMSAGIRFKQVFAVVCHSGLPSVIFAILGTVVMFMKRPDDFNIQNPLMFNVGYFMDPQGSSKFLYSLATSIDLFSFWMIFLIAAGLKAAAGKRLSFGGAMAAVVIPWAVYVLAKSSLAGMFS